MVTFCVVINAIIAVHSRANEIQPPSSINVIYPKEGQLVTAVDSTFILGSINPVYRGDEWLLYINGRSVPVHHDGGFLAFLPVTPGEFSFILEAFLTDNNNSKIQFNQKHPFAPDTAQVILGDTVTVRIPEPLHSFSLDSLRIGPAHKPPRGDLALSTGETIQVSFQATPYCRAWFSIPGVVDSVPMVEIEPQQQAYWGESVFGAGAVPDSMKIKGVYAGFFDITSENISDTARINYYLTRPDLSKLRHLILLGILDEKETTIAKLLSLPDTTITTTSAYTVSTNSLAYPFTVQFTDSVQIVRLGPRKGYLATFQPKGIEALAVGREGEWYKIKLSKTTFGWVNQESVTPLPKGILPPLSYVISLRTYSYPDKLLVKIPLSGKHPFRVIEDNRRTVRLQLFGVTSDTDWIRYDASDKLVELITWSQPEEGLYELKLTLSQDIWGYDTFYEGNTLTFQLNRPPERVSSIKGKTIIIDPGHSRDPGAMGPTGLTEAEANLSISLALRRVLEKKGARVVMTRDDTSHVELYDRPALANMHDADLYISIHNNALPDGVNPFTNNGTSSYYYQPHSIDLARFIHDEMVRKTGLNDHGLFHGNLAVIRPTQYPAVLVECAFMLLPEQEADLKTGRFQLTVAKAITKGIEEFLKNVNDK